MKSAEEILKKLFPARFKYEPDPYKRTFSYYAVLSAMDEARKEALEEVKELFTPVNSIGIDDRNNLLFDQASIIRLIDSLFTLKEKK